MELPNDGTRNTVSWMHAGGALILLLALAVFIAYAVVRRSRERAGESQKRERASEETMKSLSAPPDPASSPLSREVLESLSASPTPAPGIIPVASATPVPQDVLDALSAPAN